MKIIEHGTIPEQRPPWPIAYHFSCRNCRCQFQIEEGDTYSVSTEKTIGGTSELSINCPECATSLTFYSGYRITGQGGAAVSRKWKDLRIEAQ